MSDYYWLTETQLELIKPYFPRSHGKPRVDDRRVISGIIHVIRNGLRWRDAPQVYGPHKTLYNRFVRCSRMGVFDRIFSGLVANSGEPDTVMIGDKGYDSDEFRDALNARKIKACIPPRSNRTVPRHYSKTLYKQRHKIENMFSKLKDWRRIATRYDRCPHTFMSAICIAATVIFWIHQ